MAAEDYAGMGLSDEEIAALDEPEDEAPAPIDEDVSDELDDEGEGEQEAAGEAGVPPAAAEPASAQDPAPTPPDPAPAQIYIPPVPEGAVERLAALEQAIAEIKQKRHDGLIDFDDADDQLDALRDERSDLKAELKAFEIAARSAEHQAAQSWETAQTRFFSVNAAYQTDPLRYAALDAAVKAVANEPTTQGKTFEWVLNEAKARVERAFGVTPPAPQQTSTARTAAPEIPPTLGGIPAAGANSTSKDGFAHLDALDGLELEMALARMSDAEQAAYLGG